jgi:hypothetical protein
MPVECKSSDPVESYRKYYQTPEKQKLPLGEKETNLNGIK